MLIVVTLPAGAIEEVEVNLHDSVEVMKWQLYSLCELQPAQQKLVGCGLEDLKDNESLQVCQATLQEGSTVRLVQLEDDTQGLLRRVNANAEHVKLFEDPATQAKAREKIPVARLQQAAEAAAGASATPAKVKDELLTQLLAWFKGDFFSWTNNVPCEACGSGETECSGQEAPNLIEQIGGSAGGVEVYHCGGCSHLTRFPRYNNPLTLLDTRKGRCGEWANCFTLCARAMGFDARHVHI